MIRAQGDTRLIGAIALLASSGALICCALPIALVTLGLGSAVAALASAAPWLVFLSLHKDWIFLASAALIGFAAYRQGAGYACPSDPLLAAACARMRGIGRVLIGTAATIWAMGFVAAYLAEPIARWLDG